MTLTPPIKVICADDHELYREGIKNLLKKIKEPALDLLAVAKDGKELVGFCEKLSPDVVLVDIRMPEMDGIEATKAIKKILPKTAVLALSNFNEEQLVLEMLEAGASGYLLKNTTRAELANAIARVYDDKYYFTPDTAVHLASTIKENARFNLKKRAKLTEREIQIIRLIGKGYSSKAIASRLNLSTRTIDSHRDRIQDKIGKKTIAELVGYAIKHGIIDISEL